MKHFILVHAVLVALVGCSSFEPLSRPRQTAQASRRSLEIGVVQCGLRKITQRALILGGSSTAPGEWPWHAAIYHISDNGRLKEYKCGGTLIKGSYVVTTASCAKYGIGKPEGSIVVELGQYDLTESFAHVQRIPVSRAVVHNQNESGEHKYGIGMLQLKTSPKYTDYVQPACLPRRKDTIEAYDDRWGTIVGWGFVEPGKLSDKLMKAEIPVISIINCLTSDRDFFAREIYAGMFCAGLRNGTNPCFGDAGGGMFFRSEWDWDQSWTLRGITSFTRRSYSKTGGCDPDSYFGLVNVAHFVPWIEETIANFTSGPRTQQRLWPSSTFAPKSH